MKVKLSIIIPVYNTEKYLCKCMDSVVKQTLKEIEIICVDDGSADGSAQILDRYVESDNRIKVIHQKNKGLINARKTGIKYSSGNFIGFVDSDDWIESDYFEKMVMLQEKSQADIIAAGFFYDLANDSKIVKNDIATGVYSPCDIINKLLYGGKFYQFGLQPNLWTKIIRRSMLIEAYKHIDERIRFGEDAAAVYSVVSASKTICISDICDYHYIQRQGSDCKTYSSDELERIDLLIDCLSDAFKKQNVYEKMLPQLDIYKKWLVFMRNMSAFDKSTILTPYGGIPENSRVIIYGAGTVGQNIYAYLSKAKSIDILLWADKNYNNYIEKGMNVKSPDEINKISAFDYILIANNSENIAEEIREYLTQLNIPDKKIKWLSKEFLEKSVDELLS